MTVLNRPKLYHGGIFLLLWVIMSLDSCLRCQNLYTHQDNHDSANQISLYVQDLMQGLADNKVKISEVIQELKQNNIKLWDKDQYGRNVIQHIIHAGITPEDLEDVLKACKQQYPDQEIAKILNEPDCTPNKDTAFICAVNKIVRQLDIKSMKLIEVLLQHGAIPSPEEQKRSLLTCVRCSNSETSETNIGVSLFKHLAKKFKDNDLRMDQATAVAVASAAARNNDDDLMQYILENPDIFPINAASKDKHGNTLLHHAVRGTSNKTSVIDLLVEKYKSPQDDYINQVNNESESALHVAVRQVKLSFVRALIKAGANVHLKTKDQKTPIDIADDLIQQKLINTKGMELIKKKLQGAP